MNNIAPNIIDDEMSFSDMSCMECVNNKQCEGENMYKTFGLMRRM